MKIREAIDRIDGLKHNTFTIGEKVAWLSRLDGLITTQIHDLYRDKAVPFFGYTEQDMEEELLVEAPYDEIYIRWLETQIDYYNGEISRYNNSNAMYQAAWDTYRRYYNRTHMPTGQTMKF